MLTTEDFVKAAIADRIDQYPAIAPLYRVADPRILQHLQAMATMLAMLSSQMEVAFSETFEKVRDTTVLADAAMRGVIRKATPAKVRLSVTNANNSLITIYPGRELVDSSGRLYRVDAPATVLANSSGTLDATQISSEELIHTVSGSVPFYPIEIPESTDDSYLSGLSVSDMDGPYEYRERYVNTAPGDRVFHVESDDRQRLYIRFGQEGIVATQPKDGLVITITIYRCAGEISLNAGSPFSFNYLGAPEESNVTLATDTVLSAGQNPIDMATLRSVIKYPAVYDHNAVYLGEFEFLVRRVYPTAQFLSVWNESIEETARGADVDNINTLFVAVLSADGTEDILSEPDPETPVAPTFIDEIDLTATQKGIRDVILRSDDSYRVKFYTPVRSEIAMTVTATISTSYISGDVSAQIKSLILTAYGESAAAMNKGSVKPLYKDIYQLLRKEVQALADIGSDIKLTIAEPVGDFRPELWRYVSIASLTVTVTTINTVFPAWG